MPYYSEEDIKSLRRAGKIAANTLYEVIGKIRPGVTTQFIDDYAGTIIKQNGAKSAPRHLEKYPANICISVNEIVAHGLPKKRMLRCGDLVNVDIAIVYDDFVADLGYTLMIGEVDDDMQNLCRCSQNALFKAVSVCKPGTPFCEIGKAIENEARKNDYTVLKNLCSHGVGKKLHEYPANILNYYDESQTDVLEKGMVIALEPFISTGACRAIEANDGWSLTTHNNSRVAQFEHTVLITDDKPEILTVL